MRFISLLALLNHLQESSGVFWVMVGESQVQSSLIEQSWEGPEKTFILMEF
jgi:hypothetical protein